MKRTIKLTVLTLALSMVSVAAFAQGSATTTNAADNISATVIANCRIANFALAFGNYDPIAAADTDAQTAFNVRCTKGTVASIELGLGINDGGTGIRKMTDGTDLLSYGLFTDAARSVAWSVAAPKAYNSATNAAVGQVAQVRMGSGQTISGIAKADGTVEIKF